MNETHLIKKNTLFVFVLGVLFAIAAAILFFIGYGAVPAALLTVSLCMSGVGIILLAFSAHDKNGWIRMFSVAVLLALAVLVTLTALAL